MENCRHVSVAKTRIGDSLFNPASWACHKCGSTDSACLTCHGVSCGRYNKEHSLQHAQRSGHPLAMEINRGFVYCYQCDDYILNDTPGGDIRVLRDILTTISNQDFDVSGSETRSRRTAALPTPHVANIVLRHRRIALLGKVFSAWRDVTSSKRHPKRHVEMGKRVSPRRSLGGRKRTASLMLEPSVSETSLRKTARPPTPSPITEKEEKDEMVDMEEESASSSLPPGVTGLRNLGNTCYMNSVLQILSNLDEFRERFLSLCPVRVEMGEGRSGGDDPRPAYSRLDTEECVRRVTEPREESGSRGGSLSEEILALLRVMWSGRMSLVIPQGFLQALWSAVPSFKGYRQQDAQEFLCKVLDKLADELESRDELTPSTSSRPSSSRPSSLEGSEAAVRDFVGQLFSGELRSSVTCSNCGHSSLTRESFSDLSLEFPPKYQDMKLTSLNLAEVECELDEMLGHFTKMEDLGPVYACPSCAQSPSAEETASSRSRRTSRHNPEPYVQRRDAEKQLSLSRLPRLLRLHLKRFRWGPGRNQRDKLSLHVTFPHLLSMRPYLAPDVLPNQVQS